MPLKKNNDKEEEEKKNPASHGYIVRKVWIHRHPEKILGITRFLGPQSGNHFSGIRLANYTLKKSVQFNAF